jgi:hypothetical protein
MGCEGPNPIVLLHPIPDALVYLLFCTFDVQVRVLQEGVGSH